MGIMEHKLKSNKHSRGIPDGGEKEIESMFKAIIAENFPNLGREMDIQINQAQGIPNILNMNRATLRHIIIVKS